MWATSHPLSIYHQGLGRLCSELTAVLSFIFHPHFETNKLSLYTLMFCATAAHASWTSDLLIWSNETKPLSRRNKPTLSTHYHLRPNKLIIWLMAAICFLYLLLSSRISAFARKREILEDFIMKTSFIWNFSKRTQQQKSWCNFLYFL